MCDRRRNCRQQRKVAPKPSPSKITADILTLSLQQMHDMRSFLNKVISQKEANEVKDVQSSK